jgi:type I restriction enzyme S subunit
MKAEIKKRIEAIKRGEVPDGYKRTKVGIVPKEWEVKKAKEVFKSYSNKKHGGLYPVLSATQDQGIIPRDELDIDIKYDKENINSYKKIGVGDYVISLRSFQGGIEYSEHEGLVSPAYTVLRNIMPISSVYFKEYFKTPDFISRLNGSIYGIRDGKQIGYEDFSDLFLHYPSYPKQQKIAKVLIACDKVIELKEKLLAEKSRQKKWLSEKLLNPNSGMRLPGFKGEWEKRKLADICDINITNLNENSDPDYEFYYLDISSVDGGNISLPKEKIKFRDAPVRARKLFKKDDILMSTVRPYLHGFAIINFDSSEFIASTGFCILSTKRNVSSGFVFYQLYTNKLDVQYNNCLVGTNYPALNGADIEQLEFNIPKDLQEQKAIANILFASDNEIEAVSKEVEEWLIMKKALMQILLTGIVRID